MPVQESTVPTFSSRMTLSFALTAVMTVALLVAVLSVMWEGQFQQYTRQNMVRMASSTAATLAVRYQEEGGWNAKVLSAAEASSLSSTDVGVQVLNAAGEIIYDETWAQNEGAAADSLLTGEDEPEDGITPVESDAVASAPIEVDGTQVGTVRVWAVGSDGLLTKSDATFRANSYGVIAGAAGAAILLACVMGVFVSRSLTRPLKKITECATAIKNGDLTARCELTSEDEIGELGRVVDEMAATVERDITTEHRLTSDVAHELRTPLMAMLVNVEAMQDGVLPADSEHLAVVSNEVRRLSRLVDTMLALSRMETGSVQFEMVLVDVPGMVRDLCETQSGLFEEQGLRLTFYQIGFDAAHPAEVYADPDRLSQALVNLMSNALRYTPEGGSVTVTVENQLHNVCVMVSDTGIGIAKEDLPMVFSRFWRSDVSRERVSGGMGVGLALSKEIVTRMGGTITVESELGEGTTFTITLPKGAHEQSAVAATLTASRQAAFTHATHVSE
jgi:signal transduction histidine kinase